MSKHTLPKPHNSLTESVESGEVRRLQVGAGVGGAELKWHVQHWCTDRQGAELRDWPLQTVRPDEPVDVDCMGAVYQVDCCVRLFTCATTACHLVPVTNRFMDLDISSSWWKRTQLFRLLLSFACEMRRLDLQEGLWLENTEQLEAVSRSQAPRLSLSDEWKGSSERLFHH